MKLWSFVLYGVNTLSKNTFFSALNDTISEKTYFLIDVLSVRRKKIIDFFFFFKAKPREVIAFPHTPLFFFTKPRSFL